MGQVQKKRERRTYGRAALPRSSCTAPSSKCVQAGLKIFGDAWTLFIINSLTQEEKRFCEIQRTVQDINPVTLTSRLKKLEKLGFIIRKKELMDKLSVSYSLTKKGKGMLPVLRQIETFARAYLD